MAKAHLPYSFSCQKMNRFNSCRTHPNSSVENIPWSRRINVCCSPLPQFTRCEFFCVIFTNAQRSCPMLASELTAELAWSESDTIEISLIWCYVHYVYSECCEAFFINSWAKIISIGSKDMVPCTKQLALGFSVFLRLIFARSFSNVDNF